MSPSVLLTSCEKKKKGEITRGASTRSGFVLIFSFMRWKWNLYYDEFIAIMLLASLFCFCLCSCLAERETLLRKLQWHGHVSRSSGLAKTFLKCTVKGERRQGRQRKRWEDNIREWTGLEFDKSQRVVENREKWRKLVAKSSVAPQRPSRLRDWWWWWWWFHSTDAYPSTGRTRPL